MSDVRGGECDELEAFEASLDAADHRGGLFRGWHEPASDDGAPGASRLANNHPDLGSGSCEASALLSHQNLRKQARRPIVLALPLEEVVELLRFAGSRKDQEHEAQKAIEKLTAREKEALSLLTEGLDSKQIAVRLNISVKTERNHMASILAKLGTHSRLQTLVFALRHGVVDIH